MKRALFALVFALLPVALAAQVPDRDVLLTPDGTLYTIESIDNEGSSTSGVIRYLRLTIQRPNERQQTAVVPESLTAGIHWRPALAYDAASQTLFIFWLKMPNAMSSELLLASYASGTWHPAVSIDNQPYHLRYNLRIGITHKLALSDQTYGDVPMLLIHAIWWEETGYGENARYAMFGVQKGLISAIEMHDLDEFAPSPGMFPNPINANFNPEILKHPAFADNGTQDSIDVIYGNLQMNDFVRVRLKPIAEGRIHIPIGAHPGGPRTVAPKSFTDPWSGPISTIVSPHDGSMLLYNATKDSVNYILYSGSSWSSAKSVPLSDKLSADAAVAALTRMMSQ